MGEIVIKVPGDFKETFEIERDREAIKKVVKKLEVMEDIVFLQTHYSKVKNAVRVEDIDEEELTLQGD
ncbi:hypothetical protein [Phorcysia thermohydrogeniphila]|uniref:Uncharacterized protein n=1 Tax=Phorcysia thermohydrogeniphila TaxID=936138 RepID=A0A4R1GBH3_9BACT|nr:hypothetical protein [Phorcysia thermohydrogeniphila]TCK04040.1 hypothetical protein CLV27_1358 [Phorcysia thermohydrogeniphila]